MSSAIRWAGSPRFISAWPIRARALSLVVAGCGYGAHPTQYAQFQAQSRELAKTMLDQGMAHVAATYGHGPSRLQLQGKGSARVRGVHPALLGAFRAGLGQHHAGLPGEAAVACTTLTAEMARITAPVLIVAGDEDDAVLEPSLLMKRTIPTAALSCCPSSGHMTNLEDPALFNRLLEDFFHQVEAGRWPARQ